MSTETQTIAQPDRMPSAYEPKEVEARHYAWWENSGFFTADANSDREPFVIMIPPPNVTGSLHMGHAVNNVLQDILIRWKRMEGREALWLPGTDHAGIATQNVVEKELKKDGLTRDDLGRERFIERVWKWKEEYGSTIINQLKRLGCSCDWSRERFTMDDGYYQAVRTFFVKLYEKKLIYRGKRIINWCPRCLTALSDIEAETPKEIPMGKLYHFRYPIDGEEGRYIVVATTRPETMLGDSGVAVHPNDERYKDLIGKSVRLPLVDRLIPIVADGQLVDPEFGSGVVKVTPAHDANDFDAGERNGLEQIVIMDESGVINENGGDFAGQDRFEARESVVKALDDLGLLEKIDDYEVPFPKCYRCATVVEPYLSTQWFVSMKGLAEPAIKAVKDETVRFVPKRWENLYLEWMENIRDWCISRQIWWGHQIPVWYCECGEEIVQLDTPSSCPKCASENLTQDPDVLDTWFSSGLWPFATLGWPEKTDDLKKFYPGSTLVTGRDIIYHWVARMVMTGIEFMGDVPFTDIVINPLIMDDAGKRQSKSSGTGVDPLLLIDEFGADAVRFSLASMVLENQDIKFGIELSRKKLGETRNFLNKLWNASRFVLMNLEGIEGIADGKLDSTPEDRWIRSRLNQTVADYERALTEYRFGEAVQIAYHFFWDEFCDWYIEWTKPRVQGDDEADKTAAARTLVECLDTLARMLHPLVPHITEELWQAMRNQGLPVSGDSATIMRADWPTADSSLVDVDLEATVGVTQQLIRGIREVRNKMNISRSQDLTAMMSLATEETKNRLTEMAPLMQSLAGLGDVSFGVGLDRPARSSTVVIGDAQIFIPLEGVIDLDAERGRLESAREKLNGQLHGVQSKLGSASFREKAPEDVVQREIERKETILAQIEKLDEAIAELQDL